MSPRTWKVRCPTQKRRRRRFRSASKAARSRRRASASRHDFDQEVLQARSRSLPINPTAAAVAGAAAAAATRIRAAIRATASRSAIRTCARSTACRSTSSTSANTRCAKSTKDDFVVQVRQIPIQNSRAVAVNQAMATKIGGKRVTVSLENGAVVLRDRRRRRHGRSARGEGRFDHASGERLRHQVHVRVARRHDRDGRAAHALRAQRRREAVRRRARHARRTAWATTTARRRMTTSDGASLAEQVARTGVGVALRLRSRPVVGRRSSIRRFPIRPRPCPIATPPRRRAARKASPIRRCCTTASSISASRTASCSPSQYAQQQAVLDGAGWRRRPPRRRRLPEMRVLKMAGHDRGSRALAAGHLRRRGERRHLHSQAGLQRPGRGRKVFVAVVDPHGKNIDRGIWAATSAASISRWRARTP